MGFFIEKKMANVKKPGGKTAGNKKAKKTTEGEAGQQAAQPGPRLSPLSEPKTRGGAAPGLEAKPKKVTPQALVKIAYEEVGKKLGDPKRASKGIDDLVKLMKLEKDLGGERQDVKEIKVRWEKSEDKSSNGE
ncbi:MAG TPA: hypothetical protein VEU62_04195 [Bryobacterales bacterium]|nr:hypothetical protein [Bryobacterales bacterium]